jgi:hypothetical protein
MRRSRALMILLTGSLVVAFDFAPVTARAWDPTWDYRTWGYGGLGNYCGAGNAMCVQACDDSVPGGFILGRCYDHCYRGTAVCSASQIPVPGRHRVHLRRRVDP